MEEARYWMWAKSKPELNPRVLPPSPAMNLYAGDSWEEQAFAEDAAGALGGCVWPPRSYSCSFCRRDFRSAQALGGHMNVHRRERAGLKQSPNPKSELVVPQSHALNTCTSFGPSYSSQMCSFLYNNPSSNFSPLSHLIRVSSPPPKINNALHFFSPNAQKTLVSLDHSSWSSFRSDKRDRVLDSTIKNDEKKSHDSRVEKEDCVTEDLSMSLNLVVRERQTNTCSDEEVASCKRRRIEEKPSSFMPKLSAVERCEPQAEVLKLCSSGSVDELDLELRLGYAPKVN